MKKIVYLAIVFVMLGLTSYDNILEYGIKKLMARTQEKILINDNLYELHIGRVGPIPTLTDILRPLP